MERAATPVTARAAAPRPRSEAALEHEADRMAALALAPAIVPAAAAGARAAPPRAGPGGEPLPLALRQRFEPRFGVDFGQVRIHDDAAAHAQARAAGAQASSRGASIVFAAGRWQPHTSEGLSLLAHELAHVAQSAYGAPPAWRHKPEASQPVVKWYQPAIDQVAYARAKMAAAAKAGGPVIEPSFHDSELALLALCEAVDQADLKAVPQRLAALLKVGLRVQEGKLGDALATELGARIFELGLENEAETLRKAYAGGVKVHSYDPDPTAQQRRLGFLDHVLGTTLAGAAMKTADETGASLKRFARSYVVLRDTWSTVNHEAARQSRGDSLLLEPMAPMMSSKKYQAAVRERFDRWYAAWQTFMEQAITRARTDLEATKPAGHGGPMLGAMQKVIVGDFEPALDAEVGKADAASAVSFEVSKTRLPAAGSGEVVDAFDVAAGKARPTSVPITTYDAKQTEVQELRRNIRTAVDVRRDQIQVLGKLYGELDALVERPKFVDTLADAEEAADTHQSLRAAGGLKLHDDDSWRRFLLQKYHDLTAADAPAGRTRLREAMDPGDALREIVGLLFGYLQAFTVHARYTNLYDVGVTPYFNRPFPRTLTGQLVHDCGVYAMRAAYMLSLVRKELGLKFYFVRLPAHVSLVINGESGSVLPTVLIENDHYQFFPAWYLDEQREKWEGFQAPPGQALPAGPSDDTQFVGELAAADYIDGPLDMPMRVSEVPAPVADAKAEQRQLWAYYQSKKMDDVFGDASRRKGDKNEQFHRHYLEMTEKARLVYNRDVVPFWNEAGPKAWDDFMQALGGQRRAADDAVEATALSPPLVKYHEAVGQAFVPVQLAYAGLDTEQRALSQRLRSDPGLAKDGVRYSAGIRAAMLVRAPWERYDERLLALIRDTEVQAKAAPPQATAWGPFRSRAEPPWVPAPAESISPLD